ncbi:MAG: hypothetical protein JNK49_10490 [Planctomycetes bacterium]|jgi:hypothetical protein|nr:hypothetical protein [Planctomycetota bacterium]
MKAWKLLLPVPILLALAMVPQGRQDAGDPSLADIVHVLPISELNYVNQQGTTTVVSSRNVVEIRVLEDHPHGIRLELYYDNGDYSLVDAQAFHLLRNAGPTREVRLVRGKQARMRFPKGI